MTPSSCFWALHVDPAGLDERERRGLDLALRIAQTDAARHRGRRFAAGHGSGNADGSLYGVYYATEEEAGKGPYCIVCREYVPPEVDYDEAERQWWVGLYLCPSCGNQLRPRQPKADRRREIPPRLTIAKVAGEAGLSVKEARSLILGVREKAYRGLSDRAIRRRIYRKPRPSQCEDCGATLPADDRPESERVGRPRRYCERCSTPAARVARSRGRKA